MSDTSSGRGGSGSAGTWFGPTGAIVAGLLVAAAVAAFFAARTRVPECTGAQSIDGGCFVSRYTAMTRANGSHAALADLASTIESNEYARGMCHQLTHVIGRTAGEMSGKPAFTQGNDLCASGYFHGVTEAVMLDIGAGRVVEQVLSVCGDERDQQQGSYSHYNCVHGMGHGFMAVYNADIFRSLTGCDALVDAWEQRHCYGGVFMENLTAFTKSPEAATNLRPAEPLYPCTAVDSRYKGECYIEQTAYALFVRNDDFAAVFGLCRDTADPAFRTTCYQGLGGDAAIKTSKFVIGATAQADTIRALCLQGPDEESQSHCVIGAVETIVRDLSGNDAPARAFCTALDDDSLAAVCETARIKELRAFSSISTARPHHRH